VQLRPESILDLESEADGLVTAGGVTSWQDLALHLIGRFCGREEALRIAKVYLLPGHDDGQLPYAAMTQLVYKDDAVIAKSQEWIAQNYSSPNPVSAMTERSGLTPRTFARRFRSSTGYLPKDYVHALRIEEAKQAIETGDSSLDEIGAQVGYEDATFFRRLFKRRVGLTPAAYRRKFAKVAAIH
jgi:transcriptional regulator GlxA family with amidase domain